MFKTFVLYLVATLAKQFEINPLVVASVVVSVVYHTFETTHSLQVFVAPLAALKFGKHFNSCSNIFTSPRGITFAVLPFVV